MAGTRESITIAVDDAELRARLRTLIGALANPAPMMREIGEVLYASTKRRFSTQTDPQGQRWAQNADSTLLNYLRQRGGLSRRRTATGGRTLTQRGVQGLAGKKILTQRGHLADTIAYQLRDNGRAVEVGTNRVYAAMQQFGGTKAQWPHLWGDIPARPFLGISADDRARIVEILDDYISQSVGG